MPEMAIEMSRVVIATSTPHDQPHKKSISQRKGKIWKLLVRWLWTLLFAIFIFVVVKIYLAKGNITKSQKATFNLIQTALILAMGLNIFEAFKELISFSQRQIEAWAGCNDQEWQFLAHGSSLLILWGLLGRSHVKPRIAVLCVIWLAATLISQMAVASINLTYSVDDGTDFRGTFIREGIVNASNLSCYYGSGKCPQTVTRHALAHDYGEYAGSFECGNYTQLNEVLNSPLNYPYYCRDTPNMQEFSYRFNEYNFDDKKKSYPYFTNRILTVQSGDCLTYEETNRTYLRDVTGDGSGYKISFRNDTYNDSISIPKSSLGNFATTFIYLDIKPPAEAKANACGDRCITMWAYQNPVTSNLTGRFYQCPINVSSVSNATQNAHKIPDDVAREAAASIALQGRWSGTIDDQHYTQYQFYANGADWEIHGHTPDAVGAKMARFALQSLATMILRNPQVRIRGSVPHLGSRLIVYWSYFIPLLSCIVGMHLSLLIVAVLKVTRTAEDGEMGTFVAGDIVDESQERILRPG